MTTAFIINRVSDVVRRDFAVPQLQKIAFLEPSILMAVDASAPGFNRENYPLLQKTIKRPGTAACFYSHYTAWTLILRHGLPGAFVFEDDVATAGPGAGSGFAEALAAAPVHDIIFVNRRAREQLRLQDPPVRDFYRLDEVYRINRQQFGTESEHPSSGGTMKSIGGDGYYLAPAGARKLIAAVEAHGVFHHADLFLYYMTVSNETLDAVSNIKSFRALHQHYGAVGERLAGLVYDRPFVSIRPGLVGGSVRKKTDAASGWAPPEPL